jgi:hypothetical protein
MTAAELLRNAQPPADDGVIEKAIAELDVKIWEWTESLKSAQAQLRTAFAVRPPQRPSVALFEDGIAGSLSAAAAAAHIPTPPTPPQWANVPPVVPAYEPAPAGETDWAAAGASHAAQSSARSKSSAPQPSAPIDWAQPTSGMNAAPPPSTSMDWAQPASSSQHGGHGASGPADVAASGVMPWPTAPSGNWPDANASGSTTGPQAWPTWTPTDMSPSSSGPTSAKKSSGSSVKTSKAPKAVRPIIEGPTPEERAQKAAAEEALLSELEDAIARRVRLLRRLDPDTAIEKLIDKAKQGHAEATAAASTKDDKSSSSWWRRK